MMDGMVGEHRERECTWAVCVTGGVYTQPPVFPSPDGDARTRFDTCCLPLDRSAAGRELYLERNQLSSLHASTFASLTSLR